MKAARQLLQGMASVDARDARGNTALHWAQMGGVEQDSFRFVDSHCTVCQMNGILRLSPLFVVHFHGYIFFCSQ